MNSKKMIEAFSDDLARHGASKETISSYCKSVDIFYSHYNEPSVDNLQSYKNYLLERYTVNTVNVRVYGVNRFLKFLEELEPEDCTPGYRLSSVRQQNGNYLDKVISKKDFEKLKRRLKKDGNMKWYFIVRFLGATGVRVSELTKIKVEHIEQNYMDLCSKGRKVRRIFFPDALCDETLEWLKSRNISSGFIFCNRRGQQITPRGIRIQLKRFAQKYKISEETVYPHSFRHFFALNFLSRFNDISLLADLMGHDSIETTKIYLTKSSEEQRALIDRIVTW
ncbi:MAG: tyrosine-type recombinase/integrase [Enterocloster asparagiformis]|nr:tyrosine-type recombinase/integrase [Enterocloster asparagiformis]